YPESPPPHSASAAQPLEALPTSPRRYSQRTPAPRLLSSSAYPLSSFLPRFGSGSGNLLQCCFLLLNDQNVSPPSSPLVVRRNFTAWGDQSFAIKTSVALITTVTVPPWTRPRRSAEPRVIAATTSWPPPMSTITSAMMLPNLTSLIRPAN